MDPAAAAAAAGAPAPAPGPAPAPAVGAPGVSGAPAPAPKKGRWETFRTEYATNRNIAICSVTIGIVGLLVSAHLMFNGTFGDGVKIEKYSDFMTSDNGLLLPIISALVLTTIVYMVVKRNELSKKQTALLVTMLAFTAIITFHLIANGNILHKNGVWDTYQDNAGKAIDDYFKGQNAFGNYWNLALPGVCLLSGWSVYKIARAESISKKARAGIIMAAMTLAFIAFHLAANGNFDSSIQLDKYQQNMGAVLHDKVFQPISDYFTGKNAFGNHWNVAMIGTGLAAGAAGVGIYKVAKAEGINRIAKTLIIMGTLALAFTAFHLAADGVINPSTSLEGYHNFMHGPMMDVLNTIAKPFTAYGNWHYLPEGGIDGWKVAMYPIVATAIAAGSVGLYKLYKAEISRISKVALMALALVVALTAFHLAADGVISSSTTLNGYHDAIAKPLLYQGDSFEAYRIVVAGLGVATLAASIGVLKQDWRAASKVAMIAMSVLVALALLHLAANGVIDTRSTWDKYHQFLNNDGINGGDFGGNGFRMGVGLALPALVGAAAGAWSLRQKRIEAENTLKVEPDDGDPAEGDV